MCDLGSHIPIPQACPSVRSFTTEGFLVSGPNWLKHSQEMHASLNYVVSEPAAALLTLREGQGG